MWFYQLPNIFLKFHWDDQKSFVSTMTALYEEVTGRGRVRTGGVRTSLVWALQPHKVDPHTGITKGKVRAKKQILNWECLIKQEGEGSPPNGPVSKNRLKRRDIGSILVEKLASLCFLWYKNHCNLRCVLFPQRLLQTRESFVSYKTRMRHWRGLICSCFGWPLFIGIFL